MRSFTKTGINKVLTYWHNEVSSSQNPFIKSISADCEAIGGYSFTVMSNLLKYNLDKELISVSDEEVMTFITLSFWEYLCYCGNIDFVTGFDKTESIIRRSEMNQ